MADLPDWIHRMRNEDEEKMKQHNMKVNELMVEVNQIRQRISIMVNEGKKMQKCMEEKLNKAIEQWVKQKRK